MQKNISVCLKWGRLLAVVAWAGGLVACGGGDGAASVVDASSPVKTVESYTRGADLDAGVSPFKSRHVRTAPAAQVVRLGELEVTKSAVVTRGGVRQVGVSRDVVQAKGVSATGQLLQWVSTVDGGNVAAISFGSVGAKGLRLGVWVDQIPPSAIFRVYAQGSASAYEISGHEITGHIERNLAAGDTSEDARTYWTPSMGTDEVTLEVTLPPGTSTSSLRIAVPRLSHRTVAVNDPSLRAGTKIGESASCEKDVSCASTNSKAIGDSVALMDFVKNGGTYSCTGTLLSDAASSGTPYFLSANHCISSQTVASTLYTLWFYRSDACSSSTVDAKLAVLTSGATLLYASSSTDTSFMRLNGVPPVGAVYAGWTIDAQKTYSGQVTSVHHPAGDIQKISMGTFTQFAKCLASTGGISCLDATASTGNFMRVRWSSGTTEGGSSGGGLFRRIGTSNYLIGQLLGGGASCETPLAEDAYGRFDVAYDAALSQWLGKSTAMQRNPVYRFYNSKTGAHFFTTNFKERDSVIDNIPAFAYEGVAFYAPVSQQTATSGVFRFYNRNSGAHFYTISAAERDSVISSLPSYVYEGPFWYGRVDAGEGSTAIYRFYNASRNVHFYTISAAERDYVIANTPSYKYEGTAYYGWASP